MCAVALRLGKANLNVANVRRVRAIEEGEMVMRPTTSMGCLVLVVSILLLEFAGAGAYLASSAQAKPSDPCYGYAICQ